MTIYRARLDKDWTGKTGGTPLMHRMLMWCMKIFPLWGLYLFSSVLVIPWCMIFNHKGYLAQYHYFRRRCGKSRVTALLCTYINHCRFAEIILDRFYVYSGHKFDFLIDNYDLYKRLAAGKKGFVILSAHIGNYEVAGYTLVADRKRFNALVFDGEAETVMNYRTKLFGGNNLRMIPIKEDMSHLFVLSEALADGESVSIPADRIFGSSRNVKCRLLGADAELPLGPFAVATQRDVPVLVIHVMKDSVKKYHVYIKQLETDGGSIKERAVNIACQYAGFTEKIIRKYPEQWFNYYEYWRN